MATNEATVWKRPESVPFPSVWGVCTGKKKTEDGKIPKFIIQDIPEDRFEEIVDLMTKHFMRDEYISSTLKIADDPVSVQESREIWWKVLQQKIRLVALVDEESNRPRIAGVNITGVTLKSEIFTSDMVKGIPNKRCMRFIFDHTVNPHVNVCEYFGVDAYMSAMGLLVLPEYRGQGLSVEILKARFPLCRAVGLKAMMTFFSPLAAQVAAEKAGMKLLHEEFYEDYIEDGKKIFTNIPTRVKSFKVMGCAV